MDKVSQWRCDSCRKLAARWSAVCRACGAALPFRLESARPVLAEVKPLVGTAPKRARVYTQFEPLDSLTQGIPEGKLVLVYGIPGSCKSTLGLQSACLCDEKSLYVAAEWSAEDASDKAHDMGFRHREGHQIVEETDTERVCELIRTLAPRLVVIDSLQALWTQAGGASPASQIDHALEEITLACIATKCAAIIISKTNKKGEFAGTQRALHAVKGATLQLRKERDPKRLLVVEKTRISKGGEVRLIVDARGLRRPHVKGTPPPKLSVVR